MINGIPWKRFVVKVKTNQLLKRDGTWTLDDIEAMEFSCIRSLVRTCEEFQIEQAEILLRLSQPATFDVRFPLQSVTTANMAETEALE